MAFIRLIIWVVTALSTTPLYSETEDLCQNLFEDASRRISSQYSDRLYVRVKYEVLDSKLIRAFVTKYFELKKSLEVNFDFDDLEASRMKAEMDSYKIIIIANMQRLIQSIGWSFNIEMSEVQKLDIMTHVLMLRFDQFDPSLGTGFSTFAYTVIQREFIREFNRLKSKRLVREKQSTLYVQNESDALPTDRAMDLAGISNYSYADGEEFENPLISILRNEQSGLLNQALDLLKHDRPEWYRLIQQYYFSNKPNQTTAAIAKKDGVSNTAIQQKIKKAKSRLKQILENLGLKEI